MMGAGIRILVDPWLVDELVFFNQTWLYRGRKGALPPVDVAQIGQETDVIIISQVLVFFVPSLALQLNGHPL